MEKNKSFGGIAGIEKASKLIHNFICFGIDDKSILSSAEGSDGDEDLSEWEKFWENGCRNFMAGPNRLKFHLMMDHIMIFH